MNPFQGIGTEILLKKFRARGFHELKFELTQFREYMNLVSAENVDKRRRGGGK